ncbi:MAG: Gfo/Idh/MocA family oxidoreductase [Lachnospiraceae bacterium]|nr:Gfo/Idh/MocA family oxidoreductase [Lachnospiraceae bacterium]
MKWAILATGNIARRFAATVNAMKEAGEDQQVLACASRTIEKSETFAAEFGIPRAYGSYEAMLADPDVEAVYIASPNNLHFEHAVMCLNAGKHVLCEKPFTTAKEDAERLFTLAKEKGLFIMEGFWIRFLPAHQKMMEIVKSGELGKVVFARVDYGFTVSGARKIRKFDPALAGGALLDIGVYNLGFLRMVMGDEDPVSYSVVSHMSEFGTDDFSTIQLVYPDGKSANATTSIGITMPRVASVFCEKGAIHYDDFQVADRITVVPEGGEARTWEFPILYRGFEYQIREVSRCVAAGMNSSDVLKPEDTIAITGLMEDILQEMAQA